MRKLKLVAALVAVRLVGCSACATVDDSSARFEHVMRELKATTPGDGLIGAEWYLVSLSMAGIAAKNLGRTEELGWLTRRALDADVRAFDTRAWKSDALSSLDGADGHAGYLGHVGLLLALECGAQHAAVRRRVLGALERRYAAAPDALLETYPGLKWVPDNAVTLAAVAEGARCEGRAVPARAWLERWPRDTKTGLLKFTPRAGPRASGAGWNSYYLHSVDAAAARAQFEAAERVFLFDAVPGLAAWREYPLGVKGSGDVDSGPLVFGLSPSGTGFGIAGASLYGSKARGGMLRTAEAAGVTVPWSGPHYLLSPLVGQASVLAAKTLRRAD